MFPDGQIEGEAVSSLLCFEGYQSDITLAMIYVNCQLIAMYAKTLVISRRPVLSDKGLSSDQTIEFTGVQKARKCPIALCRIGCRDPETGRHDVFVTNNFKPVAKTIADICKARWQLELFFKWIKQNLKI
jgi:hypothetical protein